MYSDGTILKSKTVNITQNFQSPPSESKEMSTNIEKIICAFAISSKFEIENIKNVKISNINNRKKSFFTKNFFFDHSKKVNIAI